MGHIESLAWIVRMDVQKPAEVFLNPKRMMILAINRDNRDNETWLFSTILLQEVNHPNVIEKSPNLVSELNFFLSLSERLDNFLLQLYDPGLIGLPDDLGELLLYLHLSPKLMFCPSFVSGASR